MAVFRDKIVPIPKVKGITINRGDGNRVLFVKEAPYDAKAGYPRPKRITIGYVNDQDTKVMNPTSGYKLVFPKEWEDLFGEKVPMAFKYIGMYAMADAINSSTGIKDIMDECFGVKNSDAMMDFVMYSLLFETNVTEHFSTRMSDQLLYSGDGCSDSFYSDMYKNRISFSDILNFKKKWVDQCKEDGVEEVWLCIDGSNDDCESCGVTIAEKGHAKSLRNRNIVSFTYAVTEDGKPVTFDVYRGGLVDAKAMRRIIAFLKDAGISLKGVILDRGYCDSTAIRYLNKEHIPYVIMVKGTPAGFVDIVKEYGDKIKMNAEYLVQNTYLFGVQDKVQLFDNYKHDDYLTLFYDYKNGGDRTTSLLKKLYNEMDRCQKALRMGETPEINSQFKGVLRVADDKTKTEIVTEKLQKLLDEKGLYSIVTSAKMTPNEVHHLYQCRNSSETQYMIVKSHLGYGKIRVRVTKSVLSKFTIGFIASCVRYELQQAAKEVNKSTTEVIQEMSHLYMSRIGESYVPIQSVTGRQETVLKCLNSSVSLLTEIVKDENDRVMGRTPTPRHRKTGPNRKKTVMPKSDRQQSQNIKQPQTKNKSKDVVAKKRGVKTGTKRSSMNKDGTPRKKPGVIKGTKRSPINKDGSMRKKPGPKPKETRIGA